MLNARGAGSLTRDVGRRLLRITMRPQHKKNTNAGIGLGILLQFAGGVINSQGGAWIALGIVVTLLGAAAFIWGCMNYAEGKGHSKWLGLLGLLSCVGLIILVMLPDHYVGAK
jgi:hypothetical protein